MLIILFLFWSLNSRVSRGNIFWQGTHIGAGVTILARHLCQRLNSSESAASS